jgi:uncharacterized protein
MLDTGLMQELERANFERSETVIHLFIGGSELHGAKVGATNDLDIYGVFLDPPPVVLGLNLGSILYGLPQAMIGAMDLRTLI